MILTRTHLNVRRQGAKKLLASPQALHAAILSGFPPGVEPGRPLWRLDPVDALRPTLYIVSENALDLTHLEEQAGWPSQSTTVSAPYLGLLDGVSTGQVWNFRLTANPTHRVAMNGRAKIMAHVTADQQEGWLSDRANRLGVSLTRDDGARSFSLSHRETIRFRRDTENVTLARATFDGVLTVIEPEKLRAALILGIGRAKAYGCGLMTLAPV